MVVYGPENCYIFLYPRLLRVERVNNFNIRNVLGIFSVIANLFNGIKGFFDKNEA